MEFFGIYVVLVFSIFGVLGGASMIAWAHKAFKKGSEEMRDASLIGAGLVYVFGAIGIATSEYDVSAILFAIAGGILLFMPLYFRKSGKDLRGLK